MTNILPVIINFVKQLFAKPYVQVAMAEFITSVYMFLTSKTKSIKKHKNKKKKSNKNKTNCEPKQEDNTNNCKID